MTDEDWQHLLEIVGEYQELFPEGMAFIGGIAVYAYAKSRTETEEFAARSHDADFVISLAEYADLRDLVALTPNRRLSKQQFTQGGFEFDVYVETQAGLVVPVDEVMASSEERSGLRVAAIEHLLILKAAALEDRKGTSKGNKDEDDIVRILLVSDQPLQSHLLARLEDNLMSEIERAVKGDACLRLAQGNSHYARPLKEKVQLKLGELKGALAALNTGTSPATKGWKK